MIEKILDEIEIFIYCVVPGLILMGAFRSQDDRISIFLFFLPYLAYTVWRVALSIYENSSLSRYMDERRARELEASAKAVEAREARLQAKQAAKQAELEDKKREPVIKVDRVVDVTCFVVGPVLLFVNLLFVFTSKRKYYSSVFDVDAEYYGVAVGVALVAFGILRKRWRG